MAKKESPEILSIGSREVKITSPSKVYFPALGITKRDLVRYYLAVAEGALRGIDNRPIVLKRFVKGIAHEGFFQKRAPKNAPDWIETVKLRYPSGRSADEVVVTEAAQLAWMVNLGNIDLNPHPVRADDLDHPDELRVDLDPMPDADWNQVRRVAMCAREVLEDYGLTGWPKTSGSRGIHILVRIERRFSFAQMRRAAQTIAREVALRMPDEATAKWWKEERHGVFVDYNQNAKDRTVCSAYSVRPKPSALVSAPLTWDEVPTCELGDFTMDSVTHRFAEAGDLHAGIDEAPGSLEALLERADELGEEERPTQRERAARHPLITIAKAKTKAEAVAGLERWKTRHPDVAELLGPADVLVDPMRGRSSLWYRIRVNLRSVPEPLRPEASPPDPDYDPWTQFRSVD